MPEAFKKVLRQAQSFWERLDKSQKTRMLSIVAILFAAIVIGISVASKSEYVPLLTIENAKIGQEVEKVLAEKQIDFKPGDGGKILVNSRDKNKAEFALALTDGVGTSVTFDDTWSKLNLTSTESDKKHLWQNFKKNSLIAKLKMFDNVRDADVDLSLPEKSLFFTEGEANKPTAFVRIDPRGELTSDQVQGIAKVVASAIEGLQMKDVTVVDSNFNVLSQETGDDVIDRTSSQYKMKQKVKQDMESSVKKLYSGRSDSFDFINVVANPIMDFNREKRSDSIVQKPTDLDEAVVSTNTVKEALKNGSPGAEPGVASNTGSPSYPIGTNSNSTYDKKSETINREFNRSQVESEKAVGTVNYPESSMTVTLWYGQRVTDDNKINQGFMDQLKQDVASATGIPAEKISVNKYKLAPAEIIQPTLNETVATMMDQYGLFGLMALLVIGLLFALKPKKKKFDLENPEGPNFVVPEEVSLDDIDINGKSEIEQQIERFIMNKPDTVAQLLRNWIQEGW